VENGITVSVDIMRRAATVLINHLEEKAGAEVTLDQDMFWEISPDQRFNVYEKPHEFAIGQIEESFLSIEKFANDPDSASSYGLVWLADILRAVGEKIVV